eukprot:Opistho-2@17941
MQRYQGSPAVPHSLVSPQRQHAPHSVCAVLTTVALPPRSPTRSRSSTAPRAPVGGAQGVADHSIVQRVSRCIPAATVADLHTEGSRSGGVRVDAPADADRHRRSKGSVHTPSYASIELAVAVLVGGGAAVESVESVEGVQMETAVDESPVSPHPLARASSVPVCIVDTHTLETTARRQTPRMALAQTHTGRPAGSARDAWPHPVPSPPSSHSRAPRGRGASIVGDAVHGTMSRTHHHRWTAAVAAAEAPDHHSDPHTYQRANDPTTDISGSYRQSCARQPHPGFRDCQKPSACPAVAPAAHCPDSPGPSSRDQTFR